MKRIRIIKDDLYPYFTIEKKDSDNKHRRDLFDITDDEYQRYTQIMNEFKQIQKKLKYFYELRTNNV